MATEPISTAYFINPSLHSVFVFAFLLSLLGNCLVECTPPFGARQGVGNYVRATIDELLDVSFFCGPCLTNGESVGLLYSPVVAR
jgi:hypothetical protein